MGLDVDHPGLAGGVSSDLQRRVTQAGQTREQFAADAIRRQFAISKFRERQDRLAPCAQAAGLANEKDALDAIS